MPIRVRTFLSVVMTVCLLGACRRYEYSYEGMPAEPVKPEVPVEEEPVPSHYAPYTKGSTYNYMFKTKTETYYYTLTSTGDSIINGRTYAILTDGYNLQYISYENGGYYLYEPAFDSETSHHPAAVRPFLYDYLALNSQWDDTIRATTFAGAPETAMLKYTIIQKGTPMTVAGNTYASVIGVKQDGYIIAGGQANPIGTIANYYYADSTGFIEKDAPNDTIRLLSYELK